MSLFSRRGYQATSVQNILDEAGVNAGSLYPFFRASRTGYSPCCKAIATTSPRCCSSSPGPAQAEPLDKVFALLAHYRAHVANSDCAYGCPIGSLSLELNEPDPAVRELLAANFAAWTDAVWRCLDEAGDRLPAGTDRSALAESVLTTMEGAVMQARTHRDIGYFDRAVAQLRRYFDLLEQQAGSRDGAAR